MTATISKDDSRPVHAPTWNLSDLFQGIEDPAIERALDHGQREADALVAAFKGRMAELDGEGLAAMLRRYEAIEEELGRVASFASLMHAADRDDHAIGRFYQSVQERINAIGTSLLFVTLELNRLDDATLEAQLAGCDDLRTLRPWIETVRSFRPHQLDDEVERVLHEKHITGRAAWNRLFDETLAGLRFPMDGKELTSQEVFDLLSSTDRTTRETAGRTIGEVLGRNGRLFSRITNTLAKDKQIEDGWRHFARPISSRNLANQVEDEVVDALIQAVRDAYPRLSHRYYAMKARWMGLDALEFWDRNAPLPEDADVRRAWADAQSTVLRAYGRFSGAMADIAGRFFERAWIDAEVRPGKDSGAFSHPTVPSAHPYVLMNYQGRNRDVMTLAHELGHGVHQTLAHDQGYLLSSTPLTLAETASVFGEQLTFEALLAEEDDPKRRRILLAGKIEDKINTVVRQIAFCEFERRVHDARQKAELSPDDLGDLWMDVQKESLGPAFVYRDEYRAFWSYIPHFIHVPFYVYAYAFGDCLASSLYSAYERAPEGFEQRYLELLRAGGTLRHKELLEPFGFDAADPAFWNGGLQLLERMIDQLEDELHVAGIVQ